MAYIGPEPNPGQNREVDDISSSFNGSTTAFTLQVNSQNVSPGSPNNLIVSIGGVVQNPNNDYTVNSSTITFTTAPASGLSFFAIVLGQQIDTQSVADASIGNTQLTNPLAYTGLLDLTGNTSSMGLPRGTDAQEPSAGSTEGHIRYNNDDNLVYFSDGNNWNKISATVAVLTSVTGQIVDGVASNLTLAGNGFLSSSLVVNFLQSADSINVNVTVTPTSDTAATVAVPSSVFSNVTAGNAVTIKVTNSDGMSSGTVNTTAVGLPTGGSITTSGGFRIHTFTSSGTFGLTYSTAVQYLVIAGGAGVGTRRHSGGGGAGGYRCSVSGETSGGGASAETAAVLSAANYTVTVGAGGASSNGPSNSNSNVQNGNNSVFGTITSLGGGFGSTYGSSAGSGGCGGGAGSESGTSFSPGSGTSGQGYAGGDGQNNVGGGAGGGGGGAGAVGTAGGLNGNTGGTANGGAGGVGQASSINGSSTTRAGGGGGGGDTSGSAGSGGSGGGGNGANGGSSPQSGSANTGGGAGGGGSDGRTHPNGGSGIVIVRYAV